MLVAVSEPHLEALVRARLRKRVEGWRAQGLLAPDTAVQLMASLDAPAEPHSAEPAPGSAQALETQADEIAASIHRAAAWRPGWGAAFFHAMEEAARAEREAAQQERRRLAEEDAPQESDLGSAMGSGSALFGQGASGTLGGLEALVALDGAGSASGREGSLKLHEYVWWFLGALLVLGGSIMGVREAWRALGGVPRQLIVTGALFIYHAGFVGLGVFLARRSLSAGRVLASIGLALMPVVFVALAALVALSPMAGLPCALVVTGTGLITLRVAGLLLHRTPLAELTLALFPSLLAEVPVPWLDSSPWLRTLCAFVGVAAVGGSVWRSSRTEEGKAPLVSVGVALYGALALAVFSVAGSSDGFDALQPGSASFVGMVLWAVTLSGLLAAAAMGESVRKAYARAAPVVEVLAHAVAASGAVAGCVAAFSLVPGVEPWVDVASAFAPAAAALIFFLLHPRRHSLVHLGVLATTLTGSLLMRLLEPGNLAWWFVGPAAVASGLLLMARQQRTGYLRIWLLLWGVVLSVGSMLCVSAARFSASVPVQDSGQGSAWPQVATGALIAVAAHLAAGHQWRGLHYLGGFAVPFALLAALQEFPTLGGPWPAQAVFVGVGGIYGLAALLHGAWARRASQAMELSPLDDLSLLAAAIAIIGPLQLGSVPTALATVLLLLRVRRDRSRLVSFVAAVGCVFTLQALPLWLSPGTEYVPGSFSPFIPAVVLGFSLIAAFRGRGVLLSTASPGEPRPQGRSLLGRVPLPFPESGRPLFTDGFASAALVLCLWAVQRLAAWTSNPVDAERPLLLLQSGLLVLSALAVFFSRGFVAWRLRGSVVALAAGGLLIVLTAVINRAGRPLPPDVVALRMPLIGAGLWALALVARRFGPWLARRLENEPQGRFYHWVPHAGVVALIAVLLMGAYRVALPLYPSRALAMVPPLMPLGAAMLSMLLVGSFRSRYLVHQGLVLGLVGAALVSAQQAVLGPQMVPLMPPDGQWIRAEATALASGSSIGWTALQAWMPPGATVFLLWQRAFAGIAAAALVYAAVAAGVARAGARLAFLRRLLAWEPEVQHAAQVRSPEGFSADLRQLLQQWAVWAVALVAAAAFFQPGLTSAELTLATGVLLFLGWAQGKGRNTVGLGILLIVHALAHRERWFPAWPGPVLALVGLAVVALGPRIVRWRGRDEAQHRLSLHLAGALYALAAVGYALATQRPTHSSLAVIQLISGALSSLEGSWMRWAAFPVTAAIVATTVLVGAVQWRGALASLSAAWGSILAGFAGLCGLSVVLMARAFESGPQALYETLFTQFGAALALGAAGSAALAHGAGLWLKDRRQDISRGLGRGRDVWLIGCGVLLSVVAVRAQSVSADALPLALAALGLAVIVALHCAWSEHTGRHVYFVQVAVVGVYAMVRSLYVTGLRPEHDALFALALGFALVGVTVLARRAGIPPVADATRRFAAFLPLVMWWVLPAEATHQAALLAGGSGMLYAAIGGVENSRWFGSLAAAACNLALLIGALAFGLDGLEIYLAPLGLLLLMLGQLFTSSLPHAARNALRVLGGLLLYVPAAAKLSLQVGLAADGTYALIFGGTCLLGVMVGMVLHIRAYLALGTLFLTLDVVANLVHAGLRDHRVGFLVMTLTGLTIVSGRVLATLKRQQLEVLMRRVRVELRGWD
ncbi:hypothetical protein [Hyalangium minutum]|uniref:Uncharacterized protein n=1 Tax=Hyalangium minutum TaxID=394096 RepID=A0A085WWH4_9BACT|nr:hypothetical protein [Hyalangium minutum]KFE72037.1 hypothetical protein DB31_0298 [Hyalangium minutum]